MSAFGNIVDAIHGFQARAKTARVDDQLKNYLTDADSTIKAVNQIDPRFAIALNNQHIGEEDAERTRQAGVVKQATGYLSTLPQGSDYGHAIDGMTPMLKNQLGMDDGSIANWKAAIQANPAMITALDEHASNAIADSRYKSSTVAPGGAIVQGGKEIYRAPFAPQVKTLRRGDGGTDLVPFDPNTGSVGGGAGYSQPGPAAAPAAPAAPGGSAGVGAPVSIRNNNPGALRDDGRSKWRGMTGSKDGFLQFDTPENGRRAQVINIMNQQRLHGINTVQDLVTKYAPSSDNNDPVAYANTVASAIGVAPGDKVNLADPVVAGKLADAMASVESGGAPGTVQAAGATAAPAQAAPASGAPGVYSTAGKPQIRAATAAELQGYPAGTAAQVDGTGKLINLRTPTGAAAAASKKLDPVKLAASARDTYGTFDRLEKEARAISADPNLANVSGSINGYLPNIRQGSVDVQGRIDGLNNNIGLAALSNLKSLSATGASGFGNLSNKEGDRLDSMLGNLKNPRLSLERKQSVLADIVKFAREKKVALAQGIRTYQGQMGQPQPDAAPALIPGKSQIRNPTTNEVRTWNGTTWAK